MHAALLAMLPNTEAPASQRKVSRLQRLQARLEQQVRHAALVCPIQLPRGARPSRTNQAQLDRSTCELCGRKRAAASYRRASIQNLVGKNTSAVPRGSTFVAWSFKVPSTGSAPVLM